MKADLPASAVNGDAPAVARAVGLRYVSDDKPGIRRKVRGDSFEYVDKDGQHITDDDTLARIKSLAIPPAWTDVWICPRPNGHLQATGRDAKGRKQYRYHPRWRSVRDENKYSRMIAFGRALPDLRRKVHEHLSLPGLPREKVLATLVYLLEATMIRVGNEEYARTNRSYGLTTLRDKHVQISGSQLQFQFKGKSGVQHKTTLRDPRIARIVRRSRDLPGQELFQYIDENGERCTVDSSDVNDYLRTLTGEDFTAKDFRTWSGTMLAALALQEFEKCDTATQAKKNVVQAIESVAKKLGNTPAICRKCYVHPAVMEGYLDGSLLEAMQRAAKAVIEEDGYALSAEEEQVLAFLKKRLQTTA
jgi:DNA topoisomerase-1